MTSTTEHDVAFGENMRRAREAGGLSQTGLAKALSAAGL